LTGVGWRTVEEFVQLLFCLIQGDHDRREA